MRQSLRRFRVPVTGRDRIHEVAVAAPEADAADRDHLARPFVSGDRDDRLYLGRTGNSRLSPDPALTWGYASARAKVPQCRTCECCGGWRGAWLEGGVVGGGRGWRGAWLEGGRLEEVMEEEVMEEEVMEEEVMEEEVMEEEVMEEEVMEEEVMEEEVMEEEVMEEEVEEEVMEEEVMEEEVMEKGSFLARFS